VIAVVDAKLSDSATPEEDYFLASQAANAGCVVLSRCQLASQEEISGALSHLGRAAEAIRCRPMPGGKVLAKDWDALTDGDFRMLMGCGWCAADYEKRIAGREGDFQSLSFLDLPLDGAALREKGRLLFQDPALGRILRVKGFYEEAGQWYQFNATADEIRTEPAPERRAALLVIGCGLNEDGINLLLTGRRPEHHIL
jgi:G3E family GTPase